MKNIIDSTTCYTDRAGHYVRSRPDYPTKMLEFFQTELGLSAVSRVADVGAGTGILTKLLLKSGAKVIAVEPNASMRAQAEATLGGEANFQSLDGTAEATGLADRSVDFVTAGQAFHWFKHDKAKVEFSRILATDGWVILVWNERRDQDSHFGKEFDEFVDAYRPDRFMSGFQMNDDAPIHEFFRPGKVHIARFDNYQSLDLDGLSNLVLSRSYTPLPGDDRHDSMMNGLRKLFDSHQICGQVRIDYDANAYYGRLHV